MNKSFDLSHCCQLASLVFRKNAHHQHIVRTDWHTDLARILKQRFVPFGLISHSQIYPALAQLEKQGLVRYQIVEQQSGRPNKKVYELTEEGRASLQQWVESPTLLVILNDEFFLKAYSLWLANPERMRERFRERLIFTRISLNITNRRCSRSWLRAMPGPRTPMSAS